MANTPTTKVHSFIQQHYSDLKEQETALTARKDSLSKMVEENATNLKDLQTAIKQYESSMPALTTADEVKAEATKK